MFRREVETVLCTKDARATTLGPLLGRRGAPCPSRVPKDSLDESGVAPDGLDRKGQIGTHGPY